MTEEPGAEERLAARGILIHDDDWPDDIALPEHGGYAGITPNDNGSFQVDFVVRPGMSPELRVMFAEWAEERLDRFFEHGPEPDGWVWGETSRTWRLWTRLVQMPDLDL